MARGYAIKTGIYRSKFESNISIDLINKEVSFTYEEKKYEYEKPIKTVDGMSSTLHKYTPDFILDNGIIIEAKGIFDAKDRKKHKLMREQFPELVIVFMFYNKKKKLSKASKTTYEDWAIKNNYDYVQGTVVPDRWIEGKVLSNGKLKKY